MLSELTPNDSTGSPAVETREMIGSFASTAGPGGCAVRRLYGVAHVVRRFLQVPLERELDDGWWTAPVLAVELM